MVNGGARQWPSRGETNEHLHQREARVSDGITPATSESSRNGGKLTGFYCAEAWSPTAAFASLFAGRKDKTKTIKDAF